jgi:2-dehydro-3-deoxyphosphogluconate aldolase/(4S)-4-hydroxy-2-oxoglutarate aldolase
LGLRHVQAVPAQQAGGVNMLKAFAGPFPQVTFCPTGGITRATAPDYLALKNVACVGGVVGRAARARSRGGLAGNRGIGAGRSFAAQSVRLKALA